MPIRTTDFFRVSNEGKYLELDSEQSLSALTPLERLVRKLSATSPRDNQRRAVQHFIAALKSEYSDLAEVALAEGGVTSTNKRLTSDQVQAVERIIRKNQTLRDRRGVDDSQRLLSDLLGRVVNGSITSSQWSATIQALTDKAGRRNVMTWLSELLERSLQDQAQARQVSRIKLINQLAESPKIQKIISEQEFSETTQLEMHEQLKRALLSLNPLEFDTRQITQIEALLTQRKTHSSN